MTILAVVLTVLAAFCGYQAYKYGKLKSEAALYEEKWTDTHRNVAAVMFSFYDASEDLDFLKAIVHITIVSGPKQLESNTIGIIGKESEVYLPIGTYDIEITTREYQKFNHQFSITPEMIGQRIGHHIQLKRNS